MIYNTKRFRDAITADFLNGIYDATKQKAAKHAHKSAAIFHFEVCDH